MYSSTLPALSSLSSLLGVVMPFACVSLFPHRVHAGLLTCRRDPHHLGPYLLDSIFLQSCSTQLADRCVLACSKLKMSLPCIAKAAHWRRCNASSAYRACSTCTCTAEHPSAATIRSWLQKEGK